MCWALSQVGSSGESPGSCMQASVAQCMLSFLHSLQEKMGQQPFSFGWSLGPAPLGFEQRNTREGLSAMEVLEK